jgi:hypothetical protein
MISSLLLFGLCAAGIVQALRGSKKNDTTDIKA